MKTKLKTNNAKNLYDFWGDKITDHIINIINKKFVKNLPKKSYSNQNWKTKTGNFMCFRQTLMDF